MIKNIIFDLGNVLLNFIPKDFLLQYTKDLERINNFISKVTSSEIWLNLDRGIMTMDSAKTLLLSKYPGDRDLMRLFFDNWMDMLSPIQNSIDILHQLKKNEYKIFALSNFIKEALNFVKNKYDFFSIFDGQVISCEEKVIKPEKAIYEILLKRYNLIPEECVFLDDYSSFLAPAEELGVHTILYHPNINLKVELQKLKIKI